LYLSRTNKAPVSVGKIARYFADRKEGEIAVVVGTVTDDKRFLDVPKLTVCALHFTESARSRLLAAGGQVLTFDQLALQRPKGTKCVLLRGAKNNREAVKHFGRPGVPNSHAK
jgi:large subunit ribosomal protein L18e